MATSAGLVSVTTGSFVVSGTLTSFVAAEGDQLVLRGITALISRAISPSQLQLKQAWPGPDITGASDWDISLTGPYWTQSTTTNLRLSQLLAQFEAGVVDTGPFVMVPAVPAMPAMVVTTPAGVTLRMAYCSPT